MEERRREGVQLFRQWKDHLLADADHSKTIPAFIGHCLLPRCVMTPEDAMYCAAFIRRLTLEDTPYFSFMLCAQLVCTHAHSRPKSQCCGGLSVHCNANFLPASAACCVSSSFCTAHGNSLKADAPTDCLRIALECTSGIYPHPLASTSFATLCNAIRSCAELHACKNGQKHRYLLRPSGLVLGSNQRSCTHVLIVWSSAQNK